MVGVGICLLVDEHGGHVELGQPLGVGAAHLGGGANDAVDAAAVKGFDDFELALGVVMRDTEKDADAGGLGDILDPAHDAADEGVGNGGDDEADSVGALALEALGDGVGGVTHLLRQLLDAAAHFGADERAVVEGARDGRVGDTRAGGDILD